MAMSGVQNLGRSQELMRKMGWTALLLIFYRFGVHVPLPGIDGAALADFFKSAADSGNQLFGLLNMFSGGGLSNLSVFALGVMPYISSSIIMQLLQVVSPSLKRMAKEEGQAGRKKVTQYTRYGTVLISLVQGLALAKYVQSMVSPVTQIPVVGVPGSMFIFTATITVVTGTILIMWIGERITEKGIGNGISLIIFSGIVSNIPGALYRFFGMIQGGSMAIPMALLVAVLMVAILVFIVFMERGQRRIPINYAKRQMGRKMFGGQSTHLPLRVNTAGVIPPIFASSLLMFPGMILPQFAETNETVRSIITLLLPGGAVYTVLFVVLIVFFCYFYTAIIFDPKDIAENLKKQGGFIPGIRPGVKTQEYIDKVLTRITLWGAIYISFICVAPQLLLSRYNIFLGGTSLLIVVGVAMDFMGQVESHLISNQYDGLLGKARIKGRQG